MLKGITYQKSKPTRALAFLLTVIILALSLLAPFTSIVQGDHFAIRFSVEDYDKDYEVSYNDQSYTIHVDIPGKLYYTYADERRIVKNGNMQYAEYVVIDSVVQDIADQLSAIAERIDDDSDYVLASLILNFVHQTPYARDLNDQGEEIEYPKTPVETLVEEGDCEDLSALFVSIALAADLDAVLFMFPEKPGHMAAGIYIGDGSAPSNLKPYWTDDDNKAYYFCECTGDAGGIGYGSYDGRKVEMTPLTEFPNA